MERFVKLASLFHPIHNPLSQWQILWTHDESKQLKQRVLQGFRES